jgi:inhibitor of KinA sporulation pathway (predicted exonuclease)
LYTSLNIISEEGEIGRHVAKIEDIRNAYKILVRKLEEETLRKINRRGAGWEGVDWIHLAQARNQ